MQGPLGVPGGGESATACLPKEFEWSEVSRRFESMTLRFRVKVGLVFFLSLLLGHPSTFAGDQGFTLNEVASLFPSKGFERQIEFWKKIFTHYKATQVIFHDQEDLRLVYEMKTFDRDIEGDPEEADRQKEVLKQDLKELQSIFDDLAARGPDSSDLSARERHIVEVFRSLGYRVTPALLKEKKEIIRFQRGVRDKFKESLIRAGLYLPWIQETLSKMGLPVELAVLPHVESSFNYSAYSSAGAAGIWQFTRGTGRRYLRIDRSVDERLDPIRATLAAARLLSENYGALGNWPLAITSYNYGRNGMLRAKDQCGEDLRVIIRDYESNYFGFASKNFYSEFLAALEVSRNFRRYFGDLDIEKPLEFDTVRLSKACAVSHFTNVPGVSETDLRNLNPHLKRLLSRSRRVFPAGIEIRVPPGKGRAVEAALSRVNSRGRKVMVSSDGNVRYRVEEGDTLGSIASEFRVSPAEVARLSGLRSPDRIYSGQVLTVGRSSVLGDSATEFFSGSQDEGDDSRNYTVRAGDNLFKIAQRFGTTVNALIEANDIRDPDSIHAGVALTIPYDGAAARPPGPKRYVVRRGDTLLTIAQRFGASLQRILQINGIRDPDQIQQGQELRIP
ncbi:MAG: LysM peptidoglycan-binding domain-containing protein [Acidobacteriota bacterium]